VNKRAPPKNMAGRRIPALTGCVTSHVLKTPNAIRVANEGDEVHSLLVVHNSRDEIRRKVPSDVISLKPVGTTIGGKVDVTPELGRRGRPAAALAPPPRLARMLRLVTEDETVAP